MSRTAGIPTEPQIVPQINAERYHLVEVPSFFVVLLLTLQSSGDLVLTFYVMLARLDH